jgi:hypothetical protein
VTAPERSVIEKITRSGLDTRKSRPPASTVIEAGAPAGDTGYRDRAARVDSSQMCVGFAIGIATPDPVAV